MKSARTSRADIEAFFEGPAYAVVGVSANRKKFGNVVFRSMGDKQFTVYPVHPTLETVEGKRCYRTVADLPEEVTGGRHRCPAGGDGTGRRRSAWPEVSGISGCSPGRNRRRRSPPHARPGQPWSERECILMFLEPVESVHALHRWLKKLVGTYPA